MLAAALIAHFEGLSLVPYLCPSQCWTIGYGSNTLLDGSPVHKNTPPITESEARTLMEHQIKALQSELRSFVTVPLNVPQEAALLSWQYNVGTGAARGSSLIRLLNEGRYTAASLQFVRWDKATFNGKKTVLRGLTRRREIERDIFQGHNVPGLTDGFYTQSHLTT